MAKYELLKQEGRAKRGTFHTVHGDIQTPVFMNVGTVGAIKGAVSTDDLKEIKCQVELSKTKSLKSLADCTNSWCGIDQSLQIPADSRCFHWQVFAK